METLHNKEIARELKETNNPILTPYPDGAWTTNHLMHRDGAIASWSSLAYVQKASQLLGRSVRNLQNEKLGEVENFLLDVSAGRIVAVIISSGGFTGRGDELSAVPPTAFIFNAEEDILQLDVSKATLASFPHFPAGEWPKFSQSVYADAVYRFGNVDSYRNINDLAGPNNLLGDGPADMSTTAEIRKEIIADNDVSANAKTVQINIVEGHVMLRGLVNSDREKRRIGEIADRIARAANVDNQLTVMMTTSSNN
jgi:hypothetical protein